MGRTRSSVLLALIAVATASCGPSFDAPKRRTHDDPDRRPPVVAGRQVTRPARDAVRPLARLARPASRCEGAADHRARGVEPGHVRLYGGAVSSGSGASEREGADAGVASVLRAVNEGGGICGRMLDMRMRDGGWDATHGSAMLRLASLRDYLAAVVLDDRTVDHAMWDGNADGGRMPILSFGEGPGQYDGEWVWPVALTVPDQARIVVAHAFERGARTFAVAYDYEDRRSHDFARGALAEIRARGGRAYEYFANERERFYPPEYRCVRGCDVTILSMSEGSALTWLGKDRTEPAMFTSVPHWLLTRSFAESCGAACAGVLGWSPFALPTDDGPGPRALARHVGEDANAYATGAYVMTRVLADAIASVGARLTRDSLRLALDTTAFELGLTAEPLRWGDDRHANRWMRGYAFGYAAPGFEGFSPETGWVAVPA